MKLLRETIRKLLLEDARDEDKMLDLLLSDPEGMKTAIDLMEMSEMIDSPHILELPTYYEDVNISFGCSPTLKKKLAERLENHPAWDGSPIREFRRTTTPDGKTMVSITFGLEWVEYDRFGVRTQNY